MKLTVENGKQLYNAVRKCKKICAVDSPRYLLEMVELVAAQDSLVITALDGFKAIQKRVPITCEEAGSCVVDPQYLLDAIGKGNDVVELSLEGESLVCTRASITSSIKVRSEPFFEHGKHWGEPDHPYDIYLNINFLSDVIGGLKERHGSAVHIRLDAESNLKPMCMIMESGDRALVLPIEKNVP